MSAITLQVGEHLPIPQVPANWKGVTLELSGEVYSEELKTFLHLAKQGADIRGMDAKAIEFLYDDTSVDSARG